MKNMFIPHQTIQLKSKFDDYEQYAVEILSTVLNYINLNNTKTPLLLKHNSVIFFIEDPNIGVALAKQIKKYKDSDIRPYTEIEKVHIQDEEENFCIGSNPDIQSLYKSNPNFFVQDALYDTNIYERGIIIIGGGYIGCNFSHINPQSHTLFVQCKTFKDDPKLKYTYNQSEILRADNAFTKDSTYSLLVLNPTKE